MDEVDLLAVEESFEIPERGVAIVSDFPVPDHWQDWDGSVCVVLPDGLRIATNALFKLAHFNLSDPEAPSDQRWRIVVILTDWKGTVAAGSKLLVPSAIHRAIIGEAPRGD